MKKIKKLLFKIAYGAARINTSRRITLGFITVILAGALLLMLPVSSRTGEITPFFDTLFTAVSASCVTGLTVVDTYTHWSFFGQLVVLAMIQTGGLGFMAILTVAFFIGNKKIGLRNRMMLADSFSTDSIQGVVRLVKRVLYVVAATELAGAAVLAFRFIPEFGLGRGIWFSVFHSVSAFCNAGFDLMGIREPGSSMTLMAHDPVVLITLAVLIIAGGIGFVVWNDIYMRVRFKKRLGVYARLVLIMTAVLLVLGTAVIFLFEKDNPATLGEMSLPDKLLGAFFQSATTRTAGFDAISQTAMTDASKAGTVMLMLIGGSAGSTAGGLKTVTVAIMLLAAVNILRGRDNLIIFKRAIEPSKILYAMAVTCIAAVLVIFGAAMTRLTDGIAFADALYEYASAYGTVGLSVGTTAEAGAATRILLMLYMFFGRVGIMTIGVSMMTKRAKDTLKYPKANIIVG